MELRQLEYFLAVAEEGSFTRAAQRVHISQSGISAQIRRLEGDLGATLIDRSSRAATPTTAGAAALPHVRSVLAAAIAVRQAVDEVNGAVRGRVVVGMVTACTVTPLFDALASFHVDHPGIEISLFEDNSDRLIEAVRSGGADIALVGVAELPTTGLGVLPIVSERLVAVVPSGHPLARRRRVRLAEIAEHPLVCLPEGTGIRAVFDRACVARSVQVTVALEASAPGAVSDLAARGLGVGILSESTADHGDRTRSIVIADVELPALLALVWTSEQAPALRALVRHCRQAFAPTA